MPAAIVRVLVVLFAAAGLSGVGPAAWAGDASWTVRTAANDFGSDRENYSYTLNPGGQVEDGLVAVNSGTTPLELAVYAGDAFTTDKGQLDLVTRNTPSTGVGAWVHPGQDHVTVQPGQSVDVPFTLTLPDNAAPGDHMGGILTSLTQGGVERRVGIRILLRVSGDSQPGLTVEDLDTDYSGTLDPFGTGDATITYTIHNTGNTILAARQEPALSGPFGAWSVPAEAADTPQLLPGEKWRVTVPVHGVTPALVLTETVTLTPLLTDASGSTAPLSAVESTSDSLAVPWTLLLLVAVCGLIVTIFVSRRRRRTEPREASQADAGVPSELATPETADH
jgi:hypothetical protein